MTREVAAQAVAGAFADEASLITLDVGFAGLYFVAVDLDARGAAVPHAWASLFGARGRKGVAPIQFALAGLNAHINHDLALALNTACDQRGVALKHLEHEQHPGRRDEDAQAGALEHRRGMRSGPARKPSTPSLSQPTGRPRCDPTRSAAA